MIRRPSPRPVAHILGALLAGCVARDGGPSPPAGDPGLRALDPAAIAAAAPPIDESARALAAALATCVPGRDGPGPAPLLDLAAQVMRHDGASKTAIDPAAPLVTGDRILFRIHLTADEERAAGPYRVHLYHLDPTGIEPPRLLGTRNVMVPAHGSATVTSPTRTVLKLTPPAGREQFLIVAVPGSASPALAGQLDAAAQAAAGHARAMAAERGVALSPADAAALATARVGIGNEEAVATIVSVDHVDRDAPASATPPTDATTPLQPLYRSLFAGREGCATQVGDVAALRSPQRIAAIVRERLPAGTKVLFYAHDGRARADAGLDVFVFDAAGLAAADHVRAGAGEIATRVTNYRKALLAAHPSLVRAFALDMAGAPAQPATTDAPRDRDDLARAEADLVALLAPGAIAANLASARHLVVVPALDIGAVPFSALHLGEDHRPLVETTSISIAPSLFDLAAAGAKWSPDALADAFVLGNPTYAEPSLAIPQLPGAEREARAIAALLGVAPVLGDAADLDTFLAALAARKVVFVATHGVASATEPTTKSVLLFAGDRSDWLTPAALVAKFAAAPIPTELVVLSACQTGLGGVHAGGITGLARGFQLAGARRVVMSQWRVSDEATSRLMQAFTRELRSSFPAEALRRAMLELRRATPDPAAWAPFVVFGLPG